MATRRSHVTLIAFLLAAAFVYFFVVPGTSPSVPALQQFEPTTVGDIKDRPDGHPLPAHNEYTPSHVEAVDPQAEDATIVKDQEPIGEGSSFADLARGKPIMAKMANETIRAELGRAAWKVFHTILAQYPEKPTADDRETLDTYIHLFSRVYPCRECAEHFQELLRQYPPQLSSREVAGQWGCHVHNQVNKRLHKPIFDCMDISNKYQCGCDETEEDAKNKKD